MSLEPNPDSDIDEDAEQLKIKWTAQEDKILASIVERFGKENWEFIAGFLPGRTAQNCKYRFTVVVDPDLNKGSWTKEEDEKLIKLVSDYGDKNWSKVAKQLKSRRGKQCRERWHNHLDPSVIKTPWTEEEDLIIIKCHCAMGPRWAQIAKFLPGRTDNSIKNHWYATLKRKMDKGIYKMENVDLSNLGLHLQTKPTCTSTSQPKSSKELLKVKQMKKALGRASTASSPSLNTYSGSPSSSSSPSVVQEHHQVFIDAVLQMIAEDMLPLNISEGPGFRKLITLIGPQYPQLSQHTVGLQLYDAVEKAVKPQIIQHLKNCVSMSDGERVVHLTADIWASKFADSLFVVQVHFLDEDWNIHRPLLAFRHFQGKKQMADIGGELESVLLSYGLFSQNIGYRILHEAKNTIATHNVFCDYKIMCSMQNHQNEEVLEFLDDQVAIEDLSLVKIGKRLDCITTQLHCVIKEALKKCSAVEQILFELQSVVSFFHCSAYWTEVLKKKCRITLTNPCSSSNVTWNFTIIIVRKMMLFWPLVMSLLNQARTETKECSICPPTVHVTREQVIDFVGLLEPFEEAVQALQEDDITLSLIIPCIIGLDKSLKTKSTKLSYFCSALRYGLRAYFQQLIFQEDLIVSTVLDPRIKLQPFSLGNENTGSTILFSPSRIRACSVVESAIGKVLLNEEKEPELDLYLSEPLLKGDACIQVFWREATRFPRLQSICRKLLAVPASSGGLKRLFPLASCIVKAQRSKLSQHTAERLLLYRDYLKKNIESTVE